MDIERADQILQQRRMATLRAHVKGILGPEVQHHLPTIAQRVEVQRERERPNVVDHRGHHLVAKKGQHKLWQVDNLTCMVEHAPTRNTYKQPISIQSVLAGDGWIPKTKPKAGV